MPQYTGAQSIVLSNSVFALHSLKWHDLKGMGATPASLHRVLTGMQWQL